MRSSTRVWILVIAGTVLGMMLDTHGPIGSRLYPAHVDGSAAPTGLLTLVLIGATLGQAAGLGVAVALAAHAGRVVAALERALAGRRALAIATFAALLWTLGSWIPHVGFHQAIDPADLAALAAIEWGFHVTIVAAACVLARFAYALADAMPRRSPRAEPNSAHAPQA